MLRRGAVSGRARGGPSRYGGCAGCSCRRPAGARPARRPARPPSWPLRAAWIGRRRRCVAGSVDELRRVGRSCAGQRSADRSFYASSTTRVRGLRGARRRVSAARQLFKFHVHPHLRGGVVRRKVARGSSGGGGAAPGYPLPAGWPRSTGNFTYFSNMPAARSELRRPAHRQTPRPFVAYLMCAS